MFIAEPVMWALLFLALFMPWVLGLADREIGVRRQKFRGRGWAIFALCGMLVLGCWRWAEHAQALAMVSNTPISAEPVVWALLLLALFVPWLLGLIGGEIGARRKPFRGRGWAIFALSSMVLLGCWRWAEHAQALAMVANTQITAAPVTRAAVEPYPINPFRWHAILETADFYQTAEIDTRTGSIDSDPRRDVLYKPASTAATEAAKGTPLGQVYLDWGTWAVVRDLGQEPVPGMAPPQLAPNRTWTTVEFTDLRFAYSYLGTGTATEHSPLNGWVYIVDGREDGGELMNGREER